MPILWSMTLLRAIARNKRKTVALLLYAVTTGAVVGWRASHYLDAPTWLVPIARGAAAGIYLNYALILLPMMRLLLSRRSLGPLRVLLPFHKAVEAHVIAGTAVLIFSVLHVAAYVGLAALHLEFLRSVATPLALGTGLALVPLFGLLAWGAWVRDRGRFEVFYGTHFLTVPIGVLSWLHAPWFVAIVGAPLTAFLLDRLLRVAWMSRAARVDRVTVDGRDLDLVIRRPVNFDYRSGDYAFLCVPSVSRLQWHPFSLINAPSNAGDLAFRIRRAGEWTTALARIGPGTLVYVDGPFASPCRDLHHTRRAIVVAGGIGITPFVSFLEEVRASGTPGFERLHLIWFERDEASFSRFRPLIEHLEATHPARFTAALVAGRKLAWPEELARLRGEGLEGATVFFCGPKPISGRLREATLDAGLPYRTESF